MFTTIVNTTSFTGAVVSVTGNVTANNGMFTTIVNTASFTGEVVSVSGNVTGANLVATTLSATGNVVANNIMATTIVNVASHTGAVVSVSGNVTAGNLLTGGQIISTGVGSATTGAGQIYLNGAGNNRIDWAATGTGAPAFTTRSAGTKALLYPALTGSQVDYAVGIDAATLWSSVPTNSSSFYFKWYGGETQVASLDGAGILSVVGNITGANINTGGAVSATGTVTAGNITTAGTITVNSGAAEEAIINGAGNAVGNIGSASTYFNQVFAQATTALYADLAEVYEGDADYATGTVVSFGGSKEVTQSQTVNDARVAGVISANPSYLMNNGLTAEHRAVVALTGRVPTLVVGTVAKGDMMVSAGNGHAQACAAPAMGTVIGKALQDFNGSSGIIEIVVGRM